MSPSSVSQPAQSSSTTTKMEQSHSLVLNENAYKLCPDPHKAQFLYEWLRYLDRILPLTKKVDLKNCQQKLLEQLSARISSGCSAPTRVLLGRCIARVFAIADTYDLFQTINICNDTLKNPAGQSQTKLTALCVLGEMYEKLGRMVGRSYEETFQALAKWQKSAESSARAEIWNTMAKMVRGLGAGAFPIYKELYKSLSKALTDRVMGVRAAAANCLTCLVAEPDSPLLAQHDLESLCTLCIKALHCANFEVRQAVAGAFAKMAAHANAQQRLKGMSSPSASSANSPSAPTPATSKCASVEDVLQCMANGMLRGGVGGFLKTAKTATGIQTGGQRETRVGLAQAHVAVANELGSRWLKRNIQFWCRHLLELASKCGQLPAQSANSNEGDVALYIRRCVHFILRSSIGTLLAEPDQISACKQLGSALGELINCFDCAMDSSKEEERVIGPDVLASAHACNICLMEIGSIALQVNTAIASIFIEASGILEPVFSCLLHPVQSVRVAAAWSLKCITYAIPSLATPLVDRCLSRLENLKKSPEALSGFSLALAAIMAQCRNSPLGIPFAKVRQVFNAAEELIKSATQVPRLMLRKVRAGWLLISAIITMGTPFIKAQLPRLFTLWRISFPRSVEETKTERGCGDATSWEATLEARAGALGTMASLAEFCPELVNDELARRMSVPIETALGTMGMVGDLLLMHGVRIRPAIQLLHLRLFSLLYRLPVGRFESAVNSLLKELVAEITLSDNAQSAQRTSLCAEACTSVQGVFLGGWRTCSGDGYLETELNHNQTALAGALENDPLHLIHAQNGHKEGTTCGWWWPEPQPLPIAALDASIQLFARVFPVVSARCKLQLLQHFGNQLKPLKPNPRLHALQLNILCALCLAAKCIGERRSGRLDDEQLQQHSTNLVIPFLSSESTLLKCMGAETLGRLAQAVYTPQFVASNAQFCFDKIRTLKDEHSRQGYALCLGLLHRYMGSLGSGQHLNTTIGILLALAQDTNCVSVKPWALFSLSQIACTGGGMFCPYAEPVRNLCLQLLLNTPQMPMEMVRSIAKLIFALISAFGPELSAATGTVEPTRQGFLCASSMLLDFDDALVRADAIACFQHMHLFAPRHVELNRLVVTLCQMLHHDKLVLRKAALACLRQLLQQESREVCEHVKELLPGGMMERRERKRNETTLTLPESGLEGALFEMLDNETDAELRTHAKQSLLFLVQTDAETRLSFWLQLCKEILAHSSVGGSQEVLKSVLCVQLGNPDDGNSGAEEGAEDDADTLNVSGDEACRREKLQPRWPTRVFALEIVQRLLSLCDTERAHLDMALAKELQIANGGEDYLVLQLPNLVRMGFMGATSENTSLRLAGLNCLQNIIAKFAKVAEPDFPGHVLLEQYQAQISAALRPAFASETPGNVTALACQVASTWICSGVARELNDLLRIHQLLASSLARLTASGAAPSNTQLLYNESVASLEKLAILKAWAKVYICANEQSREDGRESQLLGLVDPELDTLVEQWRAAIRDWALLSLPAEFTDQVHEIGGGTFFTPDSAEICKEHYIGAWPLLLLACSVWMRQREECASATPNRPAKHRKRDEATTAQLYMMLGVCIDSLCSNRQYTNDDRPAQLCLRALHNLVACEWVQLELMCDVRMPIEMLNVLYKIVLTRDSMQTQRFCMDLVVALVNAAKRKLKEEADKAELDEQNGNDEVQQEEEDEEQPEPHERRPFRGQEGQHGVFEPRYSLVFAVLEVCMCVLVRQIPQINAGQAKTRSVITPLHVRKCMRLSAESDELIHVVVSQLVQLQPLCCPEGRIVILPSLLNMLFGVIRETSSGQLMATNQLHGAVNNAPFSLPKPTNSAIMVLRQVCASSPDSNEEQKLFGAWESIMRSALLSLLNLAGDFASSNPDKCSAMKLSAVVLLLSASSAPPSSPPRLTISEELFQQMCRLLRSQCQSECVPTQIKAIQCVRLLFQCAPIAPPFIRELSNNIFAQIRPFVEDDEQQRKMPSGTDVSLIREAVLTVEAILASATRERERLFVSLLVRSLSQFLSSSTDESTPTQRELHDFALAHLNMIGAQHRESFRALLAAAPDVRRQIETATQEKISRQKEEQQQTAPKRRPSIQSANTHQQQPSIKLATDFSTFATPKEEEARKQTNTDE